MHNKYIIPENPTHDDLPLERREIQRGSANSIFTTQRAGEASFAIRNTNYNYTVKLSLFCEKILKEGISRNGNFYIKITQYETNDDIENYIINLSKHFYISTNNIKVYKITNHTSKNKKEIYILLEFPESSVRRNKIHSDGYHLAKIYARMTKFINRFTYGEYKIIFKNNLKIDTDLYKNKLEPYITYCQAEVLCLEIDGECRLDTGNYRYKLFDTASYKVIYEILESYKSSTIYDRCILLNEILKNDYFKKINIEDIFLHHLVISILSLKVSNLYPIVDLKNIAKELLSPQIKALLKNGTIATCNGLKCKFYKDRCVHFSIKNPFYLFHTKYVITKSMVHAINAYSPSIDEKIEFRNMINNYFNYEDGRWNKFSLFLLMFSTVALSKCRVSIYSEHRVYNNSIPLILDFNDEILFKTCTDIIHLLDKFTIGKLESVKATEISKALKKNNVLTIIDSMDNGRFSILQMASTYTTLSEKCLKALTKFGCFTSDNSTRINTLIISGHGQLDAFFEKKPRSLSNKLREFIIFSKRITRRAPVINIILLEEYFSKIDTALSESSITFDFTTLDKQYNLSNVCNGLFDKHKLAHIYDSKFKMNIVSTTIIFSCLFIFALKKYEKPIFDDNVRNFCFFILDEVLLTIKQSLSRLGNPIFDCATKICVKILYAKQLPLYISKREIYRGLNTRAGNKHIHKAIQELLDDGTLIEIELDLKNRKGRPSGPIYYIPKNNIPKGREYGISSRILSECGISKKGKGALFKNSR